MTRLRDAAAADLASQRAALARSTGTVAYFGPYKDPETLPRVYDGSALGNAETLQRVGMYGLLSKVFVSPWLYTNLALELGAPRPRDASAAHECRNCGAPPPETDKPCFYCGERAVGSRRVPPLLQFFSQGWLIPILSDPNLPQCEGLALFAGGHVCEVRFAP